MASYKIFMKSGHPLTLLAAFLYFDFSFAIWVLNGVMAPFISEGFHLTPIQTGTMISIPILAGALMRFPLGVLSQYIGRKMAAIIEMSCIIVALLYGFFFRPHVQRRTRHGRAARHRRRQLWHCAFARLRLVSAAVQRPGHGDRRRRQQRHRRRRTLCSRASHMHFGWQHVYGFAAGCMLLPLLVMIFFAKEPPDVEHQSLMDSIFPCLFQADGWYFNMVYIITFGGFIGLSTFLTTFYVSQFHMTKVQAGLYTVLATFTGSATRVLGGFFADKMGGITTLSVILI